jgi:glycerate 2-kinase
LPDEKSLQAAKEIKSKVLSLTDDDILIVLITGGGSALLPLPIEPITLDEKSALIKQLSRAGATINELNTVRIAISQVKGGKLAEMGKNAHQIISLIVSDIVNDPLDLIASGPTIQFKKPSISPKAILEKYSLWSTIPASIAKVIQTTDEDLPKAIKNSDVFLIGNNRIAIEAAMNKAKSFDFIPVFLSSEVQGNVIEVSQAFFELSKAVKNFSNRDEFVEKIAGISSTLSAQSNFANDLVAACLEAKSSAGICIISGGETTVTVTGDGLGGRNQELALRFTKLCHDANTSSLNDLLLLSAGTDGIDGNNENAGAFGGSKILSNFIENVNDSDEDVSRLTQDFIFRNDSYRFYKNYAGDRYQIIIGQTGTNVMDIHLLMILPNTKN